LSAVICGDWLTGLPVNVTVKSTHEATHSNQYKLSWSVRSLSPIISYQLQLQVASDSVSCCFLCSLADSGVDTGAGRR